MTKTIIITRMMIFLKIIKEIKSIKKNPLKRKRKKNLQKRKKEQERIRRKNLKQNTMNMQTILKRMTNKKINLQLRITRSNKKPQKLKKNLKKKLKNIGMILKKKREALNRLKKKIIMKKILNKKIKIWPEMIFQEI